MKIELYHHWKIKMKTKTKYQEQWQIPICCIIKWIQLILLSSGRQRWDLVTLSQLKAWCRWARELRLFFRICKRLRWEIVWTKHMTFTTTIWKCFSVCRLPKVPFRQYRSCKIVIMKYRYWKVDSANTRRRRSPLMKSYQNPDF